MDVISLVIGGGMLILIAGVTAEGAWRKFRAMRANGGADGWQVDAPPLAPVVAAAPAQHGQRRIGRYVTLDMLPNTRKHTAVVGSTGDGKTTTMNSLLVADIASGAQCVVCSTHFTYYHPDDQTIDLRPLTDRFQVAYTGPAIRAALDAACKLKDQRMALYRAGKPVGHDVCLYFGEWDTSIQRLLGQWAADPLQELLDEGRKTNVWVSFVEVHGAQVKRFGGDSAVRAAFRTRLTGNVDATSWRAFVGSDTPQTPQPQGQWMTDRGPVRVEPPTAEQIARVAASTLPHYAPLVSRDVPSDQPTPQADAILSKLFTDGSAEPVRADRAEVALSPVTATTEPVRTGDEPDDPIDEETIKGLHAAGWSRSKIAAKMTRGNKQARLDRIRAVLGPSE
jgi:hypothetical protein